MSAVWMRLRSEAHTRRRAWLGVALLAGAFGGAVVAAVLGAARTGSVVDRHVDRYKPPDIFLAPAFVAASAEDPAALIDILSFENLRKQPSVTAGAHAFILPTTLEGVEVLASDDPRLGRSLFGVKLVEGRLPDDRRIDEASISVKTAERFGLHAGDRYTITFLNGFPGFTVDENQVRQGPRITFLITGVEAHLGDFSEIAEPSFSLTPAFLERYGDQMRGFELTMLRLRQGIASYGDFDKDVRELSKGESVLYVRAGEWEEARRSFGLQAAALWILAGILGVVTLLVIGQTVARQTFLESSDHPVLRALGLSRGNLFTLGVLRAGAIGIVAAALAAIVAAAVSPLTPFGNARLADPNPGFSAPVVPLTLGAIAVLVGVVALAALPSWRAARIAAAGMGPAEQPPAAQPARLAEALARAARGPAAGIGVRMATEPGRGRTAVPVRTTIAATVIGLVALTAALIVGSSLDHLARTPRLYGWNWDVRVSVETEGRIDPAAELQGFATEEGRDALRDFPGVGEVTFGPGGGNVLLDNVSMEPFGLPIGARVHPPILEGRAPRAPLEIAVGRKSLRALRKNIGDEVRLSFPGTEANDKFRIVGITVLPIVRSDISIVGEGAWVTIEGVQKLFGGQIPMDTGLVRFEPGADPAAVTRALVARYGEDGVERPSKPGTVLDFGRVSNMPYILALVVALLAAGTLAHGLSTAVRRRRRDLAVLKTIGLDRGQVRRAVAWQATTTSLITLAIGLPLGAIVGRWTWMLFADQTGLVPEPVVDLGLVGLAVPATILVANLISALPGRSAARTRPALVLRTE